MPVQVDPGSDGGATVGTGARGLRAILEEVLLEAMYDLPSQLVHTTLFGSVLRPILTSSTAVRAFNIVMAILLLASLIPVLLEA